jgi:hypothetical protein
MSRVSAPGLDFLGLCQRSDHEKRGDEYDMFHVSLRVSTFFLFATLSTTRVKSCRFGLQALTSYCLEIVILYVIQNI